MKFYLNPPAGPGTRISVLEKNQQTRLPTSRSCFCSASHKNQQTCPTWSNLIWGWMLAKVKIKHCSGDWFSSSCLICRLAGLDLEGLESGKSRTAPGPPKPRSSCTASSVCKANSASHQGIYLVLYRIRAGIFEVVRLKTSILQDAWSRRGTQIRRKCLR